MTMRVDLMDAILAGFSAEMILIAQTVLFILIFVRLLLSHEHHSDKRPPECIKMHHFKGENTKIFLGRGLSDPTPHRRRRAPPFEPPPNHISAYGPASRDGSRQDERFTWTPQTFAPSLV